MKKIFYNGKILTLSEKNENEIVEAIVVEDGIITKIGREAEILSNQGEIVTVDLKGMIMLPSFIDAHSHLSSCAFSYLQANLENATSFADVIYLVKEFIHKNKIQKGDWVNAVGYDHNKLIEKSHPSKKLLDEAFPDYLIAIQHKSRHFGVFNSAALKKIGFDGKDRDGYLEENEFVNAIKSVPMPDYTKLIEAYKKAQINYASFGITTVQEGMMVQQLLPIYQMLLENDLLFLDVVGYPQIEDADLYYDTFKENCTKYDKNFRLGGYKVILDGSPQGRTAFMKTPYKGTKNMYGASSMTDEKLIQALQKAIKDQRQILVHCNGDAAAEQFLECAERFGTLVKTIQPVMIHAQLVQKEQLKRMKKLGIIPSFFVGHCYYFGDTHIENFGLERASKISPAASALDCKLDFTLHQDAPVIEPNMIETIWCATNRETKNGVVLGAGEQIPVIEALKAVTIYAARQYGEESKKGSIDIGKNADFVILNENPLDKRKEELRNLSVIATYKLGEKIYG